MFISILVLLIAVLGLLIFSLSRESRSGAAEEIRLKDMKDGQEKLERSVREEISKNRVEAADSSKHLREEVSNNVARMSTSQKEQLDSFSRQLEGLTKMNDQRLERIRQTLEEQLKYLQEENSKKLEKMRETVDEKLQSTLEKRLGESFKIVSDRLEAVHKGLGEMQTLAMSVGDLKKVLVNVKTRGTLGEIQLENILQDILTAEQYSKNVVTKEGSRENVEFAVRMPGRDGAGEVVLPIDSKFPKEDYERLLDAREKGDTAAAKAALDALTDRVKKQAKDIRDKYLNPPATTDFGVMFLPTEGLYAEVITRPGLFETLQREYRVMVTGPTTLAAILNSLQMGFRTLAIEKRTSEVWSLLGAVKNEFGNFGAVLAKTHKQLQTAANSIEEAERKTRTIERKLKNVQELPSAGHGLLAAGLPAEEEGEDQAASKEPEEK
jgi:DNA recombination protein RmuC